MSSAAFLQARLPLYIRLVRLDKPIGILLLLWPTLWALWAASGGWPQWHLIIIFSLGTALMRSAGCAMNDYFDRDFDLHVDRTQNRVLTTGQIRPAEALWVAAALALASLLLILPLNGLVWLLSLAAAFLAVTYPLMKRFFAIPQAYLGIAFGFGIPMGFAAVQYEVPTVAWLMLLANVAWSVAYDTEYALVDIQDDLKLGLKTSAITFGRYDLVMIGLCYAITLTLLTICGIMLGYGLAYACGLLMAAGLAVRHLYWIRHRERSACFRAFLNNTWFGCVIFLGILAETSF